MALPPQKFREIVFQILYSAAFSSSDTQETALMLMNELKVTKKSVLEAHEKVGKIHTQLPEIDEKIAAYSRMEHSIPSYIGTSWEALRSFSMDWHKQGIHSLIMKPLDLFQGLGVEKIDLLELDQSGLKERFLKKVRDNGGPIIVQPFIKAVHKGEVRSIFFAGKELGSILKVPPQGKFLANIAQGATYHAYTLTEDLRQICTDVSRCYEKDGILLIAFDILGNSLSEVNVTCPGLMVEVSNAIGKNVIDEIISHLT